MPVYMLITKTFISNRLLAVFTILIVKIVIWKQKLVRPIVYICFCFFVCKNYNARAAASVPAARFFLSNISLAVFVFLIAKIVM